MIRTSGICEQIIVVFHIFLFSVSTSKVLASVLSSDGNQDPDVMAANAASAALMLSDIPWNGPIGVIRIGRVCGQFIVNPTMDEVNTAVSDCTKSYSGGDLTE